MAISPFAVGQQLPIMQVQLLTDSTVPGELGAAVDLTGLSYGNLVLNIYNTNTQQDQIGQGIFIIVNASQGIIQYAWDASDTAVAGNYQLFITATFIGGPLTFDPIPFTIVPK